MFAGTRKYVSEIFQDVDGGFSMKRFILMGFVVAFLAIIAYVIHYGVVVHVDGKAAYGIPAETLDFLKHALDKCLDGAVWIATLVWGERLPAAVAAYKGQPPNGCH